MTTTRYLIVPRRRFVMVAERLGDQWNASWFHDTKTDRWHPAESWNRPNFRYTLNANDAAELERQIDKDVRGGDTPHRPWCS